MKFKARDLGYVYFFGDPEENVFKIGFTKNLRARESQLNSALIEPKCMLASFPCTKNAEKILHRKFDKQRARAEWFHISDPDFEAVVCDVTDVQLLLIPCYPKSISYHEIPVSDVAVQMICDRLKTPWSDEDWEAVIADRILIADEDGV